MRGVGTAFFLAVFFGAILSPFFRAEAAAPGERAEAILKEAAVFVVAYPDAGLSVTHGDDGVYISFGQKGRFLYSPWEGCPGVSPADTGDAPLCAVLRQPYPAGAGGRRPDPGFDPGRVRSEAFLKALYGETAADVAKDLAPVRLLGETWKFSARHGAADALRRVAAKLEKAVAADPKLKAYVLPGGGTYAWRTIQGSPHLSAHSFGICIDLNVEKGVYWLWHPDPATVEKIRVGYPQEIVDAFESEGFIWGGKWHSFDFMHFEYRPELVGPARRETRR